jgi:hypothetical protein
VTELAGVCQIKGCNQHVKAKERCLNHYMLWAAHGDELGPSDRAPCKIEGCGKFLYAKRLCKNHYSKLIRLGDPLAGGTHYRAEGICIAEGCDQPAKVRQYCVSHYNKFRRYGAPLGTPSASPAFQFLQDAFNYKGDDCLSWPFERTGGYAWYARKPVSQILCEQTHGPRPTPLHNASFICGRGFNGCVNPNHIRWLTQSEHYQARKAFREGQVNAWQPPT